MASVNETADVILDLIVEISKTQPNTGMPGDRLPVHKAQAEAIEKLAKAYARLKSPRHSGT